MSLGYGMVVGHGSWWGSGTHPSSSPGKSAVQLLQESKSRYVKSDRVLISHQEPTHPDRLHIKANPNIFLSAPAHTLHPHTHHATVGVQPPFTQQPVPPPVPPRSINVTPLTAVALALHSGPTCGITLPPPLPSRSPRGVPRPRAKTQPVGDALLHRGGDLRRSLSHGPADRGNDIQMKLRRLLNTDSKESLAVQGSLEGGSGPNGDATALSGTFRAEVVSVSSHKSLPDLNSVGPLSLDSEAQRRPSCPGAITLESVPKPPPRPPRRSMGECPPKIPAKPPPRPPPPKMSALISVQNGITNGYKHPKNGSRNSSSSSGTSAGMGFHPASPAGDDIRRRPILRSKSDVTYERPLGGRWEDAESSRRSSYCSAELEDFFNSMGLDSPHDSGVNETPSTPPIYFEEISSDESGPLASMRRESDDSDELKSPLVPNPGGILRASGPGPPSLGRKLTGEPSIVEKNARVIKWLFNCQRARSSSTNIPRSLSSGS